MANEPNARDVLRQIAAELREAGGGVVFCEIRSDGPDRVNLTGDEWAIALLKARAPAAVRALADMGVPLPAGVDALHQLTEFSIRKPGSSQSAVLRTVPIDDEGHEIHDLQTCSPVRSFGSAQTGPLGLVADAIDDAAEHAPLVPIISHGGCRYSVGGKDPIVVTQSEDDVLTAFIGVGSMDLQRLRDANGDGHKVLRTLTTKYGRLFAHSIRLPGGRSRGGYSARVERS